MSVVDASRRGHTGITRMHGAVHSRRISARWLQEQLAGVDTHLARAIVYRRHIPSFRHASPNPFLRLLVPAKRSYRRRSFQHPSCRRLVLRGTGAGEVRWGVQGCEKLTENVQILSLTDVTHFMHRFAPRFGRSLRLGLPVLRTTMSGELGWVARDPPHTLCPPTPPRPPAPRLGLRCTGTICNTTPSRDTTGDQVVAGVTVTVGIPRSATGEPRFIQLHLLRDFQRRRPGEHPCPPPPFLASLSLYPASSSIA